MYPTSSDIWWPRVEWPHIFRWSVPSDEMYRALLHQVSLTPPPLPQSNLVVQSPTTPGQFDPSPPSIKPNGTEPYYTRSVWPLPPPSIEPNGTEHYYNRSVWPLPQLNLVVQSPTTPGQFDPLPSLNWTQWYRALLHQVMLTPLPQLNLVVQSPTTPGQMSEKFQMRCTPPC